MSDQAAGQRNPRTIATASSSEMLPPASSTERQQDPDGEQPGPVRKRTATSRSAVQTPTKASHGRPVSGEQTWRNAGE